MTDPKTPRPKPRQANAAQLSEAKATRVWQEEVHARHVAAMVVTGKYKQDEPAVLDLKRKMGAGFDELQRDVRALRRKCGIPKGTKPEFAEVMGAMALSSLEFSRSFRVAVERLRDALKDAVLTARTVDRMHGRGRSDMTDPLTAQLTEVGELLEAVNEVPARLKRKPNLGGKPEIARRVRAKYVGKWLHKLWIPREAAAKYLQARGYEDSNITLPRAMENQAKREKGTRRLAGP